MSQTVCGRCYEKDWCSSDREDRSTSLSSSGSSQSKSLCFVQQQQHWIVQGDIRHPLAADQCGTEQGVIWYPAVAEQWAEQGAYCIQQEQLHAVDGLAFMLFQCQAKSRTHSSLQSISMNK